MDATPHALSKTLSCLVDRHVQVARAEAREPGENACFATYTYEPDGSIVLVSIDLPLLTQLAGLLIALPSAQIEEQASKGKLDESMIDPAREVMNILASVVVDEGRAVFNRLHMRAADLSGEAWAILKNKALGVLSFQCSIANKPRGAISIRYGC